MLGRPDALPRGKGTAGHLDSAEPFTVQVDRPPQQQTSLLFTDRPPQQQTPLLLTDRPPQPAPLAVTVAMGGAGYCANGARRRARQTIWFMSELDHENGRATTPTRAVIALVWMTLAGCAVILAVIHSCRHCTSLDDPCTVLLWGCPVMLAHPRPLCRARSGTRILPSSALWRRTPRRPKGHTLEELPADVAAEQKEMVTWGTVWCH
jgi:hypothetical protein